MPPRASVLPGLVRDRASGAGALLLPPLREHVTASGRMDPQLTLASLPSLIEGSDPRILTPCGWQTWCWRLRPSHSWRRCPLRVVVRSLP